MKKTTLNIDEVTMQRLREEAARRNVTMSALVEAGIRKILSEDNFSATRRKATVPNLPRWNSGGFKVDVSNREELYDFLDKN